jgi:hypothetical protein
MKRLWDFLKEWLWRKPVTPEPKKPDHIRAQELNLKDAYKVVEYQGQRINLNSAQLMSFYKMNRQEKRRVKEYWRRLENKGEIIFQEINGQMVAVRNRDYKSRDKSIL